MDNGSPLHPHRAWDFRGRRVRTRGLSAHVDRGTICWSAIAKLRNHLLLALSPKSTSGPFDRPRRLDRRLTDYEGTETATRHPAIKRPGAIESLIFPTRLHGAAPSVSVSPKCAATGVPRFRGRLAGLAYVLRALRATTSSSGKSSTSVQHAKMPSSGGTPTSNSCAILRSANSTSAPPLPARAVAGAADACRIAGEQESPG